MKLSDIDDILKLVKNYMTDNNSQVKMSVPSNKQFNLLKIIKDELNADNYGKNSIIYDNMLNTMRNFI
jgi:polyphosphate kinase